VGGLLAEKNGFSFVVFIMMWILYKPFPLSMIKSAFIYIYIYIYIHIYKIYIYIYMRTLNQLTK